MYGFIAPAWWYCGCGVFFWRIDKEMLTRYRKHAFVVLCILAAIITPTADVFTLLLVTLPLYLLYEVSVTIVGRTNRMKE